MMFHGRSLCTFLAVAAGVESFTTINNIQHSTPVAFGSLQQNNQIVALAQNEPRRRCKGIFSLNTLAENDAEAIESPSEEEGEGKKEEAKKTYPDEDITKIAYVVNLSYDTPTYKLRELFNEHGEVQKLFMPKERSTGRPKGIAFVTMSSEEERDSAIEKLNQTEIDGRTIYVDKAKPRSEKKKAEKVSTSKKLYVGNISYDSTKDDLIELFSQYGNVEDVYIPVDRESGYPRGFAFVTMKNEEADVAVEQANGIEFHGRTIDVKESLPRGQKTVPKERKNKNEVKLYIGNMSFDTEEETLRSLFEEFGPIVDLYLPLDRFSGRPRGFAFVTMSPDDAANAIDGTDGLELDGRILRVNEAQPKGYQAPSNDDDWGDEGEWGEE